MARTVLNLLCRALTRCWCTGFFCPGIGCLSSIIMEAVGSGPAIEEERAADGSAPGLTDAAVAASRAAHGRNVLAADARSGLLATLREVVVDPMFVLLLITGAIYFWLGHLEDALALGVALLLVAGISMCQSVRNDQALGALHELIQPRAQVRRNGRQGAVPVEDLVVGDAVLVAEGDRVPADGRLDVASDFSPDEAILTGEAVAVTYSFLFTFSCEL